MANKKDSYFIVHTWMIDELELQGIELMVYAVIYGFSKDNNGQFFGSLESLAKMTGCTKETACRILKKLCDKKYIIKKIVKEDKKQYAIYIVTENLEATEKIDDDKSIENETAIDNLSTDIVETISEAKPLINCQRGIDNLSTDIVETISEAKPLINCQQGIDNLSTDSEPLINCQQGIDNLSTEALTINQCSVDNLSMNSKDIVKRDKESELKSEREKKKELYIADALEPTENTKTFKNPNALSTLEASLREEKKEFANALHAACKKITGSSVKRYQDLFLSPTLKSNFGENEYDIKQRLENAFNERSFDSNTCINVAIKFSKTKQSNPNFAWRDFVVHLTKLLKDGERGIPKYISELEKQQALERQKCFQDKKLREEQKDKEEHEQYQNLKNVIAKKYNISSDVMDSIELNIAKARTKGLHIRDPVSSDENLEHNIKVYLGYLAKLENASQK